MSDMSRRRTGVSNNGGGRSRGIEVKERHTVLLKSVDQKETENIKHSEDKLTFIT